VSTKSYRVVQWATGNIGTKSLRAVIEHPELELVGVWVHSPGKVGKDAGELCGLDATGVVATDSLDDVLALAPDCVLYMQDRFELDDVCRILEAGTNIVTTVGEVFHPAGMDPGVRERIEEACAAGRTSIHVTGSSPGFKTEALPLAMLSLARRLDYLRIEEFSDVSSRNSPEMLFGFMRLGTDPATFSPRRIAGIARTFVPSLSALAEAVGLPIDSVETDGEVAVARRDVVIAAGTVAAGTIAAIRPIATLSRRGTPLMRFQATWFVSTDVEPAWDVGGTGSRVRVQGDTPIDIAITYPVEPEQYPSVSPGFTAHPAVNSVSLVCEAAPGICTSFALPRLIPRFD
jgi:2,4-diaminopentanoate dehydrogenase